MSNASDTPKPLPTWMADHMRRYIATDGADGHLFDAKSLGAPGDVTALLLTTTGRRSGRTLQLPLFYCDSDKGPAVIASKGGAPEHPAWYLNLEAHPEVDVQILGRRFKAKARTAVGAERTAIWDKMAKMYPPYTDYQAKTQREIPVVVLEPLKGH